jgi:DNA-binding CsgD family transcriptional regulator
MFDELLLHLGETRTGHSRSEGVVFFQATKPLYGLSTIAYLGLNIQAPGRDDYYIHCAYSDSRVRHTMTADMVAVSPLLDGLLCEGGDPTPTPVDENQGHSSGLAARRCTFRLRPRANETAVFGIAGTMTGEAWSQLRRTSAGDLKALGNYFHSHVLRINGYNADNEILISARELDCLKWTAAGKTAWEASVILGISERTVRFHLNAAREKLRCATTTQAVAKAINYQLIDV